jgi:hypothetical protein
MNPSCSGTYVLLLSSEMTIAGSHSYEVSHCVTLTLKEARLALSGFAQNGILDSYWWVPSEQSRFFETLPKIMGVSAEKKI